MMSVVISIVTVNINNIYNVYIRNSKANNKVLPQ